ncbi:hypothetical protein ACGFMK_01270 [Amycolatopsis sp. NPDC049252]|uniref:hypothetical protein n=1 Tax=Amycolatopsis sp. NPDC049252 TaxID=3363933 RepID=UPI00371113BB
MTMTEQQGRLAAYWERQLDRMDERELRHAKRLPGWRDRRHRRALAVVLAAADLVLVGSAAVFTLVSPSLYFGLWMGALLTGGASFILLKILTGRMSGSFSRLLDEREREWRHRVTYVGYLVLVGLMLVAMFYTMVVAGQAEGAYRGVMMMSALLVTGTTVPPIVLGWSLPDDDPEDFDEGEAHG